MSMMTLAATPTAVETRFADSSFKSVLLLCCTGLLASFALMAHGFELGTGLM